MPRQRVHSLCAHLTDPAIFMRLSRMSQQVITTVKEDILLPDSDAAIPWQYAKVTHSCAYMECVRACVHVVVVLLNLQFVCFPRSSL